MYYRFPYVGANLCLTSPQPDTSPTLRDRGYELVCHAIYLFTTQWVILIVGLVFRWDFRRVLNSDWDQSSTESEVFLFVWTQRLAKRFAETSDWTIAEFFINSKINKEIRRNHRWIADDVSDDAWLRLVNLNIGLSPKLSRLVSVFGLSERLIQEVKWPIMSPPASLAWRRHKKYPHRECAISRIWAETPEGIKIRFCVWVGIRDIVECLNGVGIGHFPILPKLEWLS